LRRRDGNRLLEIRRLDFVKRVEKGNQKMNRVGKMVDVSQVSGKAFYSALIPGPPTRDRVAPFGSPVRCPAPKGR
jgi:hypothetical protein